VHHIRRLWTQNNRLLRNILRDKILEERRTSRPRPTTASTPRRRVQGRSPSTFNVTISQALKAKHPAVWRNNRVRQCLSLMVNQMTINNNSNLSLTRMYL
jgi:hypothetical protein